MRPISADWSEWSECSDKCGGCGTQNRTVILLNDTRIVHVRYCNTEPCVDEEEPCCEPFKFINGKCLILKQIQNDGLESNDSEEQRNKTILVWDSIKEDDTQFKFNDSQGKRKEAILAWDSIKGDDKQLTYLEEPKNKAILAWDSIKGDDKQLDDSEEQRNGTILSRSIKGDEKQLNDLLRHREKAKLIWEKIKKLEFPGKIKFGSVNSAEIDTVPNMTNTISISLNDARDADDDTYTSETNNKTNTAEILNLNIQNTAAPSVSKKKKSGNRKDYNRKNYKHRQRRYRQHFPRMASKPENVTKFGKPQQMFDIIYEYIDYYYYY
uniref:CW-type domain-containing protein n=1 Tax=Elaeophora elaphi TaxID=1147741 RepID=A0A0R3RUQ7_9BILA